LRKSRNFKTPIIILSTSSDAASIDNSRKLGASYYIPKANDYFKLRESVDYALKIDWENFRADASNFVYKN